LLIAVLKLLDLASQLADLIFQTFDPVQEVRWTGLRARDGRRRQDAQ
jgi:hypothetical protein